MEMNSAGTLKVSKKTSAARSRFLLGFSGASVNSTGCCEKHKKYDCLKITVQESVIVNLNYKNIFMVTEIN